MADDQKQPGGFKSFLQHAMPFISAGLSVAGPMGGLAGNILAKAIGSTSVPSTLAEGEQIYTAALTAAGAPADIIEKAKEAERQFELQCKQMGLESVEKILQLENADRADARAREVAAKDHTPEIGFYLLTALVTLIVWGLLKLTIPADNKAVVYMLVGSVGSAWGAAVTYFYGSSRGSDRKTELLAAGDKTSQ
jgi:hypothetical protein